MNDDGRDTTNLPAPSFSISPASDLSTEEFSAMNLFGGALDQNSSSHTEDDHPLFPSAPAHHELPLPGVPLPRSNVNFRVKKTGNAIDIITIKKIDPEDGSVSLYMTPWTAVFSWSIFKSSQSSGVGDEVVVYIDDKELPTRMILTEKGRCVFPRYRSSSPPMDEVLACLDVAQEHHVVRFEHIRRYDQVVRVCECRLYCWEPNVSIVVADLDGTLTLSDVEGHIRTLRLGQYDFLHAGSCAFFTTVAELGFKIVYLTARPIDWACASRNHLDKAFQVRDDDDDAVGNGESSLERYHRLPKGPLITNSTGLTKSLLTEVVNKNPNVFKAKVLNNIQLNLIHGGRTSASPVFIAGFGNRPTDAVAYAEVGIPRELIFLINVESIVSVQDHLERFESYCDPKVWLWILPKWKKLVSFEYATKLDELLVVAVNQDHERETSLGFTEPIPHRHSPHRAHFRSSPKASSSQEQEATTLDKIEYTSQGVVVLQAPTLFPSTSQ